MKETRVRAFQQVAAGSSREPGCIHLSSGCWQGPEIHSGEEPGSSASAAQGVGSSDFGAGCSPSPRFRRAPPSGSAFAEGQPMMDGGTRSHCCCSQDCHDGQEPAARNGHIVGWDHNHTAGPSASGAGPAAATNAVAACKGPGEGAWPVAAARAGIGSGIAAQGRRGTAFEMSMRFGAPAEAASGSGSLGCRNWPCLAWKDDEEAGQTTRC